ncbi:hypothetical protein PO909_012133 [Leuciscus waleckii]
MAPKRQQESGSEKRKKKKLRDDTRASLAGHGIFNIHPSRHHKTLRHKTLCHKAGYYKFLSLRAIYIPGSTNVGADLLSRREVTHWDWKLHPNVMGKILRSRGGPLHFTRNNTMSPLLFTDSSSPSVSGLHGPCMAKEASICVSTNRPATGSPDECPSTRVMPLAESTSLANQSLVLRNNICLRRLTVGDTEQVRPSVSGDDIPSLARAMEYSCVDRLRDTGLPSDVIETILSARVPSS